MTSHSNNYNTWKNYNPNRNVQQNTFGRKSMKFHEAVKTFLAYSNLHHAEGTKSFYRRKISELTPFFGNFNCEDITKNDINEFLEKEKLRNPNITNNTLNKYVGALKFIVKNETEPEIEIKYKKLPEIKKITPTIPTNVSNLIFAYYLAENLKNSDQRNNLMFRMLLDTGLRINELLNLKLQDIDLDSSTIHVKITKTKKERFIFYTPITHMTLINYLKANKIKEYLFIDFRSGKKLTVDNAETICFRLKNKLNLTMSISPHKWRHTFATKFQKKNNDLPVLQELLGHSSITTTQIYLHLDKDYLHEVYFKDE